MRNPSLFVLPLITFLGLQACTENESPKEQFLTTTHQVNLTKAKIYLVYEAEETVSYKRYVMTDGNLITPGNGMFFGEYEPGSVSYMISFTIASEVGGDLTSGTFPSYYHTLAPAESKHSYFYCKFGNSDNLYAGYISDRTKEGQNQLVISGGLDVGEKITVKFRKGTLEYFYYNGTTFEGYLPENAELYFSGVILDGLL